MTLNRSKWLQMAPNGSKWLQIVPNLSLWLLTHKKKHCWKLSKIALNWPKWSRMVKIGPKWSKFFQMVLIGPIWFYIFYCGLIWSKFYLKNHPNWSVIARSSGLVLFLQEIAPWIGGGLHTLLLKFPTQPSININIKQPLRCVI